MKAASGIRAGTATTLTCASCEGSSDEFATRLAAAIRCGSRDGTARPIAGFVAPEPPSLAEAAAANELDNLFEAVQIETISNSSTAEATESAAVFIVGFGAIERTFEAKGPIGFKSNFHSRSALR